MNKIAINIGDAFLGEGTFLRQSEDVGSLITIVVQAAMGIAGIILLFLLISGGIAIIAGAGNDNPEQVQKGKQAATSAIIGFVVVFAAYWIVKLIELITGIVILG